MLHGLCRGASREPHGGRHVQRCSRSTPPSAAEPCPAPARSRYAAGRLYDPAARTVAGLQPCHFVAMATPHLGCDSQVTPAQVGAWMTRARPRARPAHSQPCRCCCLPLLGLAGHTGGSVSPPLAGAPLAACPCRRAGPAYQLAVCCACCGRRGSRRRLGEQARPGAACHASLPRQHTQCPCWPATQSLITACVQELAGPVSSLAMGRVGLQFFLMDGGSSGSSSGNGSSGSNGSGGGGVAAEPLLYRLSKDCPEQVHRGGSTGVRHARGCGGRDAAASTARPAAPICPRACSSTPPWLPLRHARCTPTAAETI